MNSDPVNLGGGPSDSDKDALPGSSPKLDRLIDGVRSLEHWYAQDFERRVAGLTELLKNQIREELKEQFAYELTAQVEQIRKSYEERLHAEVSQWETQRAILMREIQELRRRTPGKDVQEEISAAEAVMSASITKASLEAERLIPDAASLGKILQTRVEDLEMKAYLRGLKFGSGERE